MEFVLPGGTQTPTAFTILSLGFILGLRHALDADHLVAIATIVSERKGLLGSSIVGVFWGIGHTAALLIAGLCVLALNLQIPGTIALLLEFLVALMIIALGARVLWKLRATPGVHGGIDGRRPLCIGLLHGMAGSTAVMLVVLATIQSGTVGMMYIGVFGIGSIAGMLIMSVLIGVPFVVTATRSHTLNAVVRGLAGAVSVGFGVFLAWEIGVKDGLFF